LTGWLNLTKDECVSKCNSMDDCYGFVTIPSENTCILKNSTAPPNMIQAMSQNYTNMNTYQRIKDPKNRPAGIPGGSTLITTTEFDSLNDYQSEIPQLDMNKKYGMAAYNSIDQSKLNNLQSRLNILANQLGLNSETYDQNSQKVIKRMVENEPKTDKQGDDFFDIKNQISYLLKELPNQERIINETDIAALKENYNYTIWSILAIGIIIGLIIINKKKN